MQGQQNIRKDRECLKTQRHDGDITITSLEHKVNEFKEGIVSTVG